MVKDAGRPLSAHLDWVYLATELRQTLPQTLFSGSRRISPRCVNEIGQEMAVAFFKLLATEDEQATLHPRPAPGGGRAGPPCRPGSD
jgi:hypothetical protein